jgi:hypothetical protein
VPPALLAQLTAIYQFRAEQELYERQASEVLAKLLKSTIFESTESSNRIEGVVASPALVREIVGLGAAPVTRSEAEIAGYRDQEHTINNGILFRADIHQLFDSGYVTVTQDHHFEVSRRIKEELENGRDSYKLNGTAIRLPRNPADQPLAAALAWPGEEG